MTNAMTAKFYPTEFEYFGVFDSADHKTDVYFDKLQLMILQKSI